MVRKLFDLMADVFSVDPSTISDKTSQKDIPRWDSLNSLFLIDTIENEYRIKLSIDDIVEITNVLDIKNILKEHGIDVTKI